MYICRALLKHGHSNFSLTIIEYCEPEQCLERENYYLSSENHEYNILDKAGSWLDHKHSDETKKIMSDTRKGKPKIEGSGKPSQAIEVTDMASPTNNTTVSYNSIREAARALNIPSYKSISNYIKNNQHKPYKGLYTFKNI